MEHNQQSFPSIFAIVLIKSKTSKYNKVHFAIDTIFAYMKTLHANTCCQVYLHKVDVSAFYPKLNPKRENLGETLDDFYMTLVKLNISISMDSNINFVRTPSSSRTFANIILITMYLHRNSPMKILQKAISEKSSVTSIE